MFLEPQIVLLAKSQTFQVSQILKPRTSFDHKSLQIGFYVDSVLNWMTGTFWTDNARLAIPKMEQLHLRLYPEV